MLFLGGLAGVLHETAFTQSERPTLLILFAAMMGLPAFLRPSGVQDAADKVKDVATEVKDQLTDGGGTRDGE
jgi:hypothetical protein